MTASALTGAVVGGQVAAVAGRVGEVGDHHADARRGAEAAAARRRLAALRAQRGAGARLRRLPQLPAQEERPHLVPPALSALVVLVLLLPAAVARQPGARQRPSAAAAAAADARGRGGRRGVVVHGGALLAAHALLELAEGGVALVLHGQVVHAGRQVVAGELHRGLHLPPLLLLLTRLGVQPEPAGAQVDPLRPAGARRGAREGQCTGTARAT